mmetsp:Transcript_11792/g.13699  ORF Transcript_11792/g.13699 Transcript_11792/m.13699 type:complete len:83 (+) Transcript_11792:568-816(+)
MKAAQGRRKRSQAEDAQIPLWRKTNDMNTKAKGNGKRKGNSRSVFVFVGFVKLRQLDFHHKFCNRESEKVLAYVLVSSISAA